MHYLSVTQAKRHWLVIALRPQRGSCAFVRIPCGTQCNFITIENAGCLWHTAVKIHTVPLFETRGCNIYTLTHWGSGQPALNSCSPASSSDFFLSLAARKGERDPASHMTRGLFHLKCSIYIWITGFVCVCLVQISKWSHKWAKYACFCVYLLSPDDASLDACAGEQRRGCFCLQLDLYTVKTANRERVCSPRAKVGVHAPQLSVLPRPAKRAITWQSLHFGKQMSLLSI